MTSERRPDFGDVTAEYRAARAGTGLVSGMSAIVWITGPDAVSFVDGQVSQDVAAMAPGSVAQALLLEPRGKLVATAWALRGDDRVGLVVDRGRAGAALERLDAFRFRVAAELTVDERPLHEVWGVAAAATVTAAGFDPGAGWAETEGRTVARLDAAPLVRVLVTGDPAPLRAAGCIPIGSVATDSVRIEAGLPVMGVDVDESTIPQESGLVAGAVSFTKGCYVGQELVARIDSRGHVNRRLVGLVVGTNVVPPRGARVVLDGEDVGSITTVGESLALRAPVAMGMARREAAGGSSVTLAWEGGGVAAVVRDLPLDDFSAEAHSPLTPSVDTADDRTGA